VQVHYNNSMFLKDIFIRNLTAEEFQETFLISAVVSVFVIRIFLRLTHYPHLGGGEYHIAHMLWGGFFMLAALIVMFSFLGKRAIYTASLLGGIGFGTFIDELGKFITSDNNYFFRPTVALLYIIFVLLYILMKFIPRIGKISEREYLINALDLIKEAAINDFDVDEEKQALAYLQACDRNDPTVQTLKKLIKQLKTLPESSPGILTKIRLQIAKWYYKIARSGWMMKIIILYLFYETLRTLVQAFLYFVTRPVLPLPEWGKLYSSLLAGAFVFIGLWSMKFSKSKLDAYRFFRIAMLVTILLTEFFAFMRTQWLELLPLTANIFMFMVISYTLRMEARKEKTKNTLVSIK